MARRLKRSAEGDQATVYAAPDADPPPQAKENGDPEEAETGPSDGFPTMAVAPWTELRDLRPLAERSVLEASWHGSRVLVASPETLARWIADWSVVTVDADQYKVLAEQPGQVRIQPFDLEQVLRTAGVVSETVPENALVIENCRGVQIGDHNKQHNEHRFHLENVTVAVDRAFVACLTSPTKRDILTSAHADKVASSTTRGGYRVIVKNSHGVQIGDHCKQRNMFEHRIKRPTLQLGDFCSPVQLVGIIDKVRDGKVAVRPEVARHINASSKLNPETLYGLTPRNCNVSTNLIPQRVVNTDGFQAGRATRNTSIEKVRINRVNIDPIVTYVKRVSQDFPVRDSSYSSPGQSESIDRIPSAEKARRDIHPPNLAL